MKKVYNLRDLDCANCAAKMEEEIAKIEGVKSVNVSFLTQKMTLEAEDENFQKTLKAVIKACKKIEPDCEIIIK